MRPRNPFLKPRALFTKRANSMMSMMRQIPEGGCLLVFNGKHISWKSAARQLGLSCFTMTPFGEQANREYRDVYIIRKGDL